MDEEPPPPPSAPFTQHCLMLDYISVTMGREKFAYLYSAATGTRAGNESAIRAAIGDILAGPGSSTSAA